MSIIIDEKVNRLRMEATLELIQQELKLAKDLQIMMQDILTKPKDFAKYLAFKAEKETAEWGTRRILCGDNRDEIEVAAESYKINWMEKNRKKMFLKCIDLEERYCNDQIHHTAQRRKLMREYGALVMAAGE